MTTLGTLFPPLAIAILSLPLDATPVVTLHKCIEVKGIYGKRTLGHSHTL